MSAIETVKIHDVDEFCKLYKINIPIKEEFEYYVETLKKSNEYKHSLGETIDSYVDLETMLENTPVRAYKDKYLNLLKGFLVNSDAYEAMMKASIPNSSYESKDDINSVKKEELLISLDFKSANYNILKTFQPKDSRELGENWDELCKSFMIHPAIRKSKSFRQIVFGNTNPKRLQTFQHSKIMELVELLKLLGYKNSDFVFISHDEVILRSSIAIDVERYSELIGMPIRATFFYLEKIKKGVFIKTVGSGEASYKTLHGVPGNKFYLYFKKYIIEEIVDERDLMYYNDGELCKWVEKDEPVKHKLPHYEKPKNILSLQVAMNEHSYLWGQMDEILPDLSAEEKRRIIELFINTCKVCLNADSKCNCWKDR